MAYPTQPHSGSAGGLRAFGSADNVRLEGKKNVKEEIKIELIAFQNRFEALHANVDTMLRHKPLGTFSTGSFRKLCKDTSLRIYSDINTVLNNEKFSDIAPEKKNDLKGFHRRNLVSQRFQSVRDSLLELQNAKSNPKYLDLKARVQKLYEDWNAFGVKFKLN